MRETVGEISTQTAQNEQRLDGSMNESYIKEKKRKKNAKYKLAVSTYSFCSGSFSLSFSRSLSLAARSCPCKKPPFRPFTARCEGALLLNEPKSPNPG